MDASKLAAERGHYLHFYIRHPRQKMGDDATVPRFIITEPCVGYRWTPEGSDA